MHYNIRHLSNKKMQTVFKHKITLQAVIYLILLARRTRLRLQKTIIHLL